MDNTLHLILRQGEDHRDWLQLCNDDQASRIGGVNDVALIDQSDAGAARNRRANRRVVELDLRRFDIRLVALHRGD